MKIASLLLQYLQKTKRLDLPGIGSFFLNESAESVHENHKQDKHPVFENISFESNTAIKENADLVQFITAQTGKIKALASADLSSLVTEAQQLLNIGNPFLFEGMGTLVKKKPGEYAFTPAAAIHEKAKEHLPREKPVDRIPEESPDDYKKVFYGSHEKKKWKKPVIIFLIVAGLALAIWGAYTAYKMTTSKNKQVTEATNKEVEPVPVKETLLAPKDSAQVPVQKDSVMAPVLSTPAGLQKFILEICDGARAAERYQRLKTFGWNVQQETKDSITYNLFLLLPASASDTSRILDSLSKLNGRRVFMGK